MRWYRMRLNGQNFNLNLNGTIKKYGFYTTRDVGAKSIKEAELKAIELIRNERELIDIIKNELDDSPMIFVDERQLLEEGEEILNNSGYVFYPEDENDTE